MYFCNMNNTEQMKNMDAAMQYLSSAENGDRQAQATLCRMFFADRGLAENMPGDFWKRIETDAKNGKDYANFIMHCRYYNDPQQGKLAYDYIRRAIRNAKVPLAFMRLADIYTDGTCVKSNNALASYYYMKAFEGGCDDVVEQLKRDYKSGKRNLINDITVASQQTGPTAQRKMDMLRQLIDQERTAGNYGTLGKLRSIVKDIYPEYDTEEAMDDILNERDTLYADLYYSFCTSENDHETSVDLQESLLQQLYAPVAQNDRLIHQLNELEPEMLPNDINELMHCLANFTTSYNRICKCHKIEKKEMRSLETLELFPYIPTHTLIQLRKDALRRILSVKDIDERINDEYLVHLDDGPELMNITEKLDDQDLQLMLISFVELNLDIRAIEFSYMNMLNSYRNGDMDYLVRSYNDLANLSRLANCDPPLEDITAETLPPISLEI